MMVRELFAPLAAAGAVKVQSGEDREVTGMTVDSRRVGRGDLFAALAGTRQDGHLYLSSAVQSGAAALLLEHGRWSSSDVGAAAVVETGEVRAVLGDVADRFFGHPSGKLDLFGVTGTNGKTSVTYLLESIFQKAGKRTGVIGTVGYRWAGGGEKAPCTTPEAVELQRILGAMADDGIEAVAMEVSSHALAQHRVRGCDFRCAVFTNLGRDHLDFHRDLEDYFAAKVGLFRDHLPAVAIINGDDRWGERLLQWFPGSVSYGLGEKNDYRAGNPTCDSSGIHFVLQGKKGSFEVRSPLLGKHNVYNILAAAAAAAEWGVGEKAVADGIAAARGIPGRFEKVSKAGEPMVLVDYAHTPDALESALKAARDLAERKLLLVFGCGGDRDRGKRPLMGAIAAQLADATFLTSDNPRSEDPESIMTAVREGFDGKARGAAALHIVADRRRAIGKAVSAAEPGDVVLIAGKGHEDYQILAGGSVHFSDHEEARRALKEAGR